MRAWAVVENGKPLQELELPTPEPKGTEVLIEVTHCGVCHSDLHIWEGYYDIGGGKKMSLKDRGVVLPLAMGHEIVGRVAKLGPDARGQGREGRRPAHRVPLARLRHLREMPGGRGQHVPRAAQSRRLCQWRLRHARDRAASAAPGRSRHARSRGGGDLCVLRHHRLFGDPQGDADPAGRGDRGGRRRRPRAERDRGAARDAAPAHRGGGHQRREARGRAEGRRAQGGGRQRRGRDASASSTLPAGRCWR